MRLSKKLLLIMGLLTIALVAVGVFTPIRFTLSYYNISMIGGTGIALFALYLFIVKRIVSLSHILSQMNLNYKSRHIPITGHDEITDISKYLNNYFDSVAKNSEHQKHLTEEYAKELQRANLLLQQEKTQRTLAEKKVNRDRKYLSQVPRYDNFTALPNRIFFNEILSKSINHSRRHSKIFAVLLVNIDKYKELQSSTNLDTCTLILKETTRRITETLRSEDVLAKLDDDEFCILLSDLSKAKFAGTVAEKLLQSASQPFELDSQEFQLTLSIGISIFPNDGENLEDLLNSADEALHKAKASGGNAYELYSKELNIEAHEHIQLETALRNAIDKRELILYYQPKYDLKRGTICGVETLARWEHPEYGIINPSRFIPLAEETGLILKIGEWILREACKTNKYWQDEGFEHLTTSVNLSSKQFHHPEIASTITKVLKETELNPQYLEIEITENIVMTDAELANSILHNIKSTGVQISIDHFGTGYTSISYLKIFPISTIKLDQIFIRGIPNNPNDVAITNGVIALSHNLGLAVVAEGVETAEQVQYLGQQNCDMVQGYFLGHPVPASKISQQFKNLRDEVMI